METQNICFFNGDMSRNGGTERCTAMIANELKRRTKYKVFIIDISNKTDECYFDVDRDIEIIHIHGNGILDISFKIRKFIKRNRIDVIINVEAMLGIYTIPAAAFMKVKNIIWEHGNFYQKQCRSIDKVRALEMRLCDYYITLTERDKLNFEQNFKGKCKVKYIYNPIEPLQYVPQYKGDTKTILSVGLVREIKGFDMLVDVANIVLKKHPDWRWLIYGDTEVYPEYMNSIRRKIAEYGIEDKLLFMNTTKNIEECYRNADIMVMTSRMEGLPMTLLEAKACKLPIVAFDVMTGPSEIIKDGINGYLIEPFNVADMGKKIRQLIEDENLRQSFSGSTYAEIEKFSVESVMKKWMSILQ